MMLMVILFLVQASWVICGGEITETVTMSLKWVQPDLYGKMFVGKEGKQELDVLFDTGSNNIWLVGSEAVNAIPGNFKRFDKTKSNSFKTENKPLKEPYSVGVLDGYLGTDDITFATEWEQITLKEVEFGVVTSMTNELFDKVHVFDTHGAIFGLNLVSPEAIPGEPEPALNKLIRETTNIPTFGFYFDKKNKDENKLVFGEPSRNYILGMFNSHNVVKVNDKYNGWNVNIKKFKISPQNDGEDKEFETLDGAYAQLMSRSSASIVGPKDKIDEMNAYIFSFSSFRDQIDIKENYKFPCNEDLISRMVSELPDVKIVIDRKEYHLSAPDYIAENEDGYCESTLIPKDTTYFILGRLFMMKYFTKFDYNGKMVHFARAK